jgi:hypothetical protein
LRTTLRPAHPQQQCGFRPSTPAASQRSEQQAFGIMRGRLQVIGSVGAHIAPPLSGRDPDRSAAPGGAADLTATRAHEQVRGAGNRRADRGAKGQVK